MDRDSRTTICFPFVGDTVGGSHLSVHGLIERLDRRRFRVLVVPQVPDGAIASLFAGPELTVGPDLGTRFPPGEPFGPAKAIRALSALVPQVRFLRRERVDIVHTNDGGTHARWALAARLAGARLVWHHRGDPEALGLRTLAPLLADRVLAVSSFALPRRRWWSAAAKAEVLHSPFDSAVEVDRGAAHAALLREAGVPDDAVVLGYFGSFIMRKRPLVFVEAIAQLRRMIPDRPVIGVMFGEADDPRIELAIERRIVELDVVRRIRLMGYRSPGAFWIAACDQLVVPAVGEPFGRTLVEAMLVGTPIVATRSGGNVEALRDGRLGLLVAADDAGALAAGCAQLIAEPAATRARALFAQTDARQRFGEEHHCARVSQIYTELAGRAA
ncbi:MAG TPA: glycosyltransferase family 4 protein [Sphingomonas sp.]|nr:glycosyltransferase family 4 protein [Sphingomonas sp.]